MSGLSVVGVIVMGAVARVLVYNKETKPVMFSAWLIPLSKPSKLDAPLQFPYHSKPALLNVPLFLLLSLLRVSVRVFWSTLLLMLVSLLATVKTTLATEVFVIPPLVLLFAV